MRISDWSSDVCSSDLESLRFGDSRRKPTPMRKFRRAPRGIRPNWRSDRSTLRKGRHDGSFTSLFAWSRCRKSRSRFPTGPSREHEEQTATGEAACCLTNLRQVLTMNTPVQFARRSRLKDYNLPALVSLAGAGPAYACADPTFDPALTNFTDFPEPTGGTIITVSRLACVLRSEQPPEGKA